MWLDRNLRLQKKIVKLLQGYYENSGWAPTREELLNRILSRKRTTLNHLFAKKDKLRRKFDDALGDCIEGSFKYIGYADPDVRNKLKVTLEGRDFIGFGGSFQEFFKRRDKLAMFLFGGGVGVIGSAVIWIFTILWKFTN